MKLPQIPHSRTETNLHFTLTLPLWNYFKIPHSRTETNLHLHYTLTLPLWNYSKTPHFRTKTNLHLYVTLTLPLWNYSKSHTPELKYTCTCTSQWHSHSETAPNPTLQDWNIPALALRIDTPTLKLLQILYSRNEIYLHLYFALTPTLKLFPGVALIAKFCVNIAFFRCRTHFSHIAASPYAQWQHQLNKLCLTGGWCLTQH